MHKLNFKLHINMDLTKYTPRLPTKSNWRNSNSKYTQRLPTKSTWRNSNP